MKKIFGISLVAVFAAMPMMAHATDVPNVPMATTGDALTTQSYVKGAYNALAGYINTKQDKITADNKLPASLVEGVASDSAVSSLASDVEALQSTVGDSTSGLVADVAALQSAVNDVDSGLATKASQSALDSVADDVEALQSTVGDSTAGLVKDVDDLQSAVGALESTMGSETMTTSATTVTGAINELDSAISAIESASSNYAAKTGVTNTISASSASTPVSVVSDWGTDSATTVNYSGTLTGASYTE